MNQITLDFDSARAIGQQMADACADRADALASGFSERARLFVLEFLSAGDSWSEEIVDAAMEAGIRPHDARAFGAVFAGLSRTHRIRPVEYGRRLKGHGTAGAIKWALVR